VAERIRVSPRNATALWILVIIAVLFFLRTARTLLIPIALAVLISYALEPVVGWFERRRVPRLAGASFVMLLILGTAGWGVYALKDDAVQVVETLPQAARRAREVLGSQLGSSAGAIQQAADEFRTKEGTAGSSGTSEGESTGTSGQLPGGVVAWGVGSIVSLAGNLVVIFFLTFFLLISGHHLRNRLIEVAGRDAERQRVSRIIDDINAQVQRYLLVLLVTAVIVAVLTWMVLAWMGVQHAAMWGILAGVFNSIPYFGPVIVSGGLLVVGLVQGGGMAQALQMAGAAVLITSLEGWLLTPPLMGKFERMSALAVFLGLLLWTWLWGEWGLILAVPMLAVLKSVADHTPLLKPVGRLMAP
jgi:predicted PurR-regulated permease PerM